jgi:hypothetical protein
VWHLILMFRDAFEVVSTAREYVLIKIKRCGRWDYFNIPLRLIIADAIEQRIKVRRDASWHREAVHRLLEGAHSVEFRDSLTMGLKEILFPILVEILAIEHD